MTLKYCPYCNVEHDAKTEFNKEHIIPFALGGSDDLTISTCAASNNNLGSEVDAPFIDFFPMQGHRFGLGLKSTSGNAPTLDLSGKAWINGKEVPISYVVSNDQRAPKIQRPEVTRTLKPDGNELWQIFGDPDKVRDIVEGKLRKQTALGKTITLEDGTTLRQQDIDRLIAEQRAIESPCILKTINHDPMMPVRFFSKMALAIGYFELGETFSRSSWANELRRHMKIDTANSMRLRGAAIWPNVESVKWLLQLFAKDDHHVILILDGEPPMMLVSLFGECGSIIPLGEVPEGKWPATTGAGSMWRISLPSRQVTKLSMTDFFAERGAQARRQAEIDGDHS